MGKRVSGRVGGRGWEPRDAWPVPPAQSRRAVGTPDERVGEPQSRAGGDGRREGGRTARAEHVAVLVHVKLARKRRVVLLVRRGDGVAVALAAVALGAGDGLAQGVELLGLRQRRLELAGQRRRFGPGRGRRRACWRRHERLDAAEHGWAEVEVNGRRRRRGQAEEQRGVGQGKGKDVSPERSSPLEGERPQWESTDLQAVEVKRVARPVREEVKGMAGREGEGRRAGRGRQAGGLSCRLRRRPTARNQATTLASPRLLRAGCDAFSCRQAGTQEECC